MCSENMAKNRHKCCQIANIFVYNLWKSIIVDLENPGKVGDFLSYFVATLSKTLLFSETKGGRVNGI